MTFSATTLDEEKTEASAGGGRAVKVELAMVKAANAPAAVFCKSKAGLEDGLVSGKGR